LATPTTNFIGTSFFNPALAGSGRFVTYGGKWGGPFGTGVTLDYSFPGATSPNATYTSNYGSGGVNNNEWIKNGVSQWFDLNGGEQQGVRNALNVWSHIGNINFHQTSDTSANVGELRFAYSKMLGSDEAGHAYLPFGNPSDGDVWLNPQYFNSDGGGIPVGSYDFLTLLHEIGHALGLKHSFQAPNAIPAPLDNYFYSIMSYTASRWSAHGDNYASFYPTTPMYYDMLAIERIYGARAFHPGNDVYTFNEGVRYFQTINDTAGSDTIVYNGTESVTVDLVAGHFSSLSEAIEFQRPNGVLVSSKATVAIGPGVVIESAHGGSGDDVLVGNIVNNILNGHAGNDMLRGGYGNDRLLGGPGNDTFRFNTLPNSSTNHDTLPDYVTANDSIQLDNAFFTKLGSAGHLLSAAFFRAASHALDTNDYIVYDRPTGSLSYDADGSGGGSAILFATLTTKPVLGASEFTVV
jgi:hypothetical protein